MAFNQDPPRLRAPAGTCDTHMHIYDGDALGRKSGGM